MIDAARDSHTRGTTVPPPRILGIVTAGQLGVREVADSVHSRT